MNFLRGIASQATSIFTTGNKAAAEVSAKGTEAGRSISKTPEGNAETAAKKLDQAKQKQPLRQDKEVKRTKMEVHTQSQNVQNSDKKTDSRAKAFFKKLINAFRSKSRSSQDVQTTHVDAPSSSSEPPKDATVHFGNLVNQGKTDEAASFLLQIDQNAALKLLKGAGADVGKALARQVTHSENKEVAMALSKKMLEEEINSCTAAPTLFRNSTTGAGFISEIQGQLIPSENKQHIQNIAQLASLESSYLEPPKENEVTPTITSENQTAILKSTEEAVKVLEKASKGIPKDLQEINQTIYEAVKAKFGETDAGKQIVGGNFLLRFANPLILANPNTTPTQRKNAMVIAKGLQNLANEVKFGNKEAHFNFINSFLADPATAVAKEQILNNLLGR